MYTGLFCIMGMIWLDRTIHTYRKARIFTMKKKLVLVLDVEIADKADMQQLADSMSTVIQSVEGIALQDLVMFDNDENNADKLIANIKKEMS